VRPTPDARVSAPLRWDEVPDAEPEAFTIDTVPERFAEIGDASEGIDGTAGSLAPLLELSGEHEQAGFGDAPWPPQYAKQEGEPARVQPSKRRRGTPEKQGVVPAPAPGKKAGPTGRRRTTAPLIEIARAETEPEAQAGLDRWRMKHPDAAALLQPADVMVDAMRGRFTAWYRIRVNLRNVPQDERPEQEALEVDYDPWEGFDPAEWERQQKGS
jgi:bifunctional non-homologous end joining protein LigD